MPSLPMPWPFQDLGPWDRGRFCEEKLPKTIVFVCLFYRWAQNTGSRAQGVRVRGSGHRAQGTGHRAQGTGHRAQGTGHRGTGAQGERHKVKTAFTIYNKYHTSGVTADMSADTNIQSFNELAHSGYAGKHIADGECR